MLQWSHLLASHKSHFQECCTSVLSHALTSAWPHTIEIYIHKHNRRQDYKQATLCCFWCDLAHLGSLPWLDPRHWNNKDEGIEIVDTFKTEKYVMLWAYCNYTKRLSVPQFVFTAGLSHAHINNYNFGCSWIVLVLCVQCHFLRKAVKCLHVFMSSFYWKCDLWNKQKYKNKQQRINVCIVFFFFSVH